MSIRSNVFQAISRRAIKRNGLNQEQTVKHLRRVFNNTPTLPLIPRGVKIRQIALPEFKGDRVSVKSPSMTILYFHGGAFVSGATRTYHNFAARLAKTLNAEVFLATYPFAPEFPFPAASNRCLEAYHYLLKLGKSPKDIVIAGDSAGGGLTLTCLLQLRDKKLPLPRCAVALSPGTVAIPDDQRLQTSCHKDAMLSADLVKQIINIYLPNKEDRSHPYASPGLANFHGLPPIMITASQDEILYHDAQTAKQKALSAGVEVEWLERSGVGHVWPVLVPYLPEANQDFKKIVAFIQRYQHASEISHTYGVQP
ncbi:alpha/beta hydrolase [Litoribacillus peritrichatus]|uniref:Alpha/beta hydrolase fold-3 domain-containing protein n=1 Tax=Litoribacillus peritrichatus TaxID=718191 RepID=A0ABP7M959_9GAMM